jgi:Carboxypeptidase regulatory-like domain
MCQIRTVNKLLLVVFALGCGPPPSPPSISNRPVPSTPEAPKAPPTSDAEVTLEVLDHGSSSTTGELRGSVKDTSGEILSGVTVAAASPALVGVQTAITDDEGWFTINALPPGSYTVTFYYLDKVLRHEAPVTAQHVTRLKVERWNIAGSSDP